MKVAVSSSPFAALLAAGRTTQLEWLERSASELAVDGVVFTRAHFPREDDEYVAQLRKVAVDLGLVPVALDDPALFAADRADEDRLRTIALAKGLGTLFVLAALPPPGDVPPATFVAAVATAKLLARAAKAANVTILLSPAPGTIAPAAADLRHFLKDVDSAWLRYALGGDDPRTGLGARDRVLLVRLGAGDEAQAADALEEARPWLLLDEAQAADPYGDLRLRIALLRAAAAKKALAGASALRS
ncbi:MAG: hypothetical protein WCE44_01675 [Candidatus Velthaea sp.]|jgi:hypothetical protein